MFNYAKMKSKNGQEDRDNTIGMILVLMSLLFDGLT